jgi:pyruvate dehydrogenase E2 component (dihydrolipoamide acetyltransferase)
LFELEGEKASQDIEAVDEGILRIPPTGPQPGSLLKVGAVVGHLVAEGEAIPAESALSHSIMEASGEISPAQSDMVSASTSHSSLISVSNKQDSGKRVIASPRARRVAAEMGIDWTQLSGSGTSGRIREQDVRAACVSRDSHAPSNERRIPLTSRRRVIVQRMVASRQQTVPVTLTSRADATNLVKLREQFKSASDSTPVPSNPVASNPVASNPVPSYQDIITKLVAEVLQQHLLLAGRWDQDAIMLPDENVLDLGMAVDTPEGLLVPVIRNVGGLTLSELAKESRRLVEKSRAGTLVAAEMQGSVFSITNLGAFGIDGFTPIINLPEVAILGLGAIRQEPVVLDDGQMVARHQLTLSLTFDHRIIDGAPAARFLQTLVSAISKPSAWLREL